MFVLLLTFKKIIANFKNGSFVATYDLFVFTDEPLQHISDMITYDSFVAINDTTFNKSIMFNN